LFNFENAFDWNLHFEFEFKYVEKKLQSIFYFPSEAQMDFGPCLLATQPVSLFCFSFSSGPITFPTTGPQTPSSPTSNAAATTWFWPMPPHSGRLLASHRVCFLSRPNPSVFPPLGAFSKLETFKTIILKIHHRPPPLTSLPMPRHAAPIL
jgi:hypothetical protein